MIINDKVWGNINIEKRYECIVNSKEVSNLKNKKYKKNKLTNTRFLYIDIMREIMQ